MAERVVSRVRPLFQRRTTQVGALVPQLYLHGLALNDFELALRGLLGDAAPLSPTSLARLKAQWQLEYEAGTRRRLDDLEVVYVWADGLSVKAGLDGNKAALLVRSGGSRMAARSSSPSRAGIGSRKSLGPRSSGICATGG